MINNSSVPKLKLTVLSRSSHQVLGFFTSPRKSEIASDPIRKLYILKTESNRRFVIADAPQDNYQEFAAKIQKKYLSGEGAKNQFFEKLINVSLGDEGAEAAKRVYDMIPGNKKNDFISQLNRAQLKNELDRKNKKNSQGSLCREASLSSTIFSIHFLNHCEPQLNKITQSVLENLKKELIKLGSLELSSDRVTLKRGVDLTHFEREERESITTKAVENVFNGTLQVTQGLPYEIKQLFHHLYEDCLEFGNEDVARQQVLGKIFLRIISPRLIDSPLHRTINDENLKCEFRSATAKVSKIIQHHVNQTGLDTVKIPDELKFAFEGINYNKQISQIIENFLLIKKIEVDGINLDKLAKTKVSPGNVKDTARYIYDQIPNGGKSDFIKRLHAVDKKRLFKKPSLIAEIITIHTGFLLEDTLKDVTKNALDKLESQAKEESFKENHQDALLSAIDSILESAQQIPEEKIHPDIKTIFQQLKVGCDSLASDKIVSLFFLGFFNQMPIICFKGRYISDKQHLDRFKEAVNILIDAIMTTGQGKKYTKELKLREFVSGTKKGAILKMFNKFVSDSNINNN